MSPWSCSFITIEVMQTYCSLSWITQLKQTFRVYRQIFSCTERNRNQLLCRRYSSLDFTTWKRNKLNSHLQKPSSSPPLLFLLSISSLMKRSKASITASASLFPEWVQMNLKWHTTRSNELDLLSYQWGHIYDLLPQPCWSRIVGCQTRLYKVDKRPHVNHENLTSTKWGLIVSERSIGHTIVMNVQILN